jgi:hypothetical protein
VDAIRRIYLEPDVTNKYSLEEGGLDEEGLYGFLCGERSFSRERVETMVSRMRRARGQSSLSRWVEGGD